MKYLKSRKDFFKGEKQTESLDESYVTNESIIKANNELIDISEAEKTEKDSLDDKTVL